MDHSFSNQEKRFILAEMLKASQIEIDAVVEFIQTRHIMPNWMEMELPRGRNMNQCLQAVNNMGIPAPPPTLSQYHSQFRQYGSQSSTQQQAQRPLQHQVQHQQQQKQPHLQQHMAQHIHPQQPQQQRVDESSLHPSRQAPLAPKRRPSTDSGEHPSKRAATASTDAMHPVSQPRILQPRPTHSPLPSSPSLMPIAPPAGRPAPKKRGRPSRAEKDAQARAAGSYPLAFIAPAASTASQNESPRSMYQPTSNRVTPEGPVSNTDYWEHQGMRRSSNSSPQPVRELFSVPSEITAESAKPDPAQIDRPTSQESVAEYAKTPKPSPPTAPVPQPSSRVAVANLLKATGSATITTGV